jgi:hypothetical protein
MVALGDGTSFLLPAHVTYHDSIALIIPNNVLMLQVVEQVLRCLVSIYQAIYLRLVPSLSASMVLLDL